MRRLSVNGHVCIHVNSGIYLDGLSLIDKMMDFRTIHEGPQLATRSPGRPLKLGPSRVHEHFSVHGIVLYLQLRYARDLRIYHDLWCLPFNNWCWSSIFNRCTQTSSGSDYFSWKQNPNPGSVTQRVFREPNPKF